MLLAVTGGLAGVGPILLAAKPAWAATYSIEMDAKDNQPGKFEFDPNVKQININDRIIWTNKTQQRHTVTSDAGAGSFDSGEIAAGGKFEWRFKNGGTYTYRCQIHPDMVGRIEVNDPNAPTTTGPPPTTATTAPPTTTTTAPPTTTTTAPPTTTTTAARPPAGIVPPVPTSSAAPPPAPSTSSSVPSTTTTTTAPPTTPSSAPPALAAEPPVAPAPPPESSTTTEASKPAESGGQMPTAAGPISSKDGKLDLATVSLVSLLVLVGVFGAWTLIRVRPGRV